MSAIRSLLNLTTLNKGGGLQVAGSIVRCALSSRGSIDFQVAVTPNVKRSLEPILGADELRALHVVSGQKFASQYGLSSLEQSIRPNVVWTLFGPAYYRPRVSHLVGFAIPHYVIPESPYFDSLGLMPRIAQDLRRRVKWGLFKRNSDYLAVEASFVKQRLIEIYGVAEDKILLVPNCPHQCFEEEASMNLGLRAPRQITHGRWRILTIAADYPHKNLRQLRTIALHLGALRPNDEFIFTVTTGKSTVDTTEMPANVTFRFVGTVPVTDCPSLYSESDIFLLPTLLECFSASYIEAMTMGVPIVTPDLIFSRDICGDAATYYDACDSSAAAQAIIGLLADDLLRASKVKIGRALAEVYPRAHERFKMYCKGIAEIANRAR